jgi:hypothetical protein
MAPENKDRRSSLRPAPASYRPSARDVAGLRPMAVVRAGDAESTLVRGDVPAPAPSQPSQTELRSEVRAEPFPLADDASFNASEDRITPLQIPPAPPVPMDLVERTRKGPLVADESFEPADAAPTEPPNVIATSLEPYQQPSGRSSPALDPAVARRRKYNSINIALASVMLVAAVATVLHGRARNAPAPKPQAPPSASHAMPPPAQASIAPPVASQPSANPTAAEPASAEAPADLTPPGTTRVTLELVPADAKVSYRGREQPGPPFEFDVASGHRMALEVKRSGFVTAKVVIDDKKPVVHFGMLRERKPKAH